MALVPRAGRDSAALAPAYVVPGVASLVAIPLLFGSLGATEYGVFALIVAVANGVPQLTTSWLEAVVVRFGHRPGPAASGRAVVVAVAASCVLGAGLATALIPSAGPVVTVVTGGLSSAIAGYLLAAARLQSSLRFGAMSSGAIFRALVSSAAAVVLGALSGSAAAAAVGLAGGFAGSSVLMLLTIRRVRAVSQPHPSRSEEQPGGMEDLSGQAASARDVTGYGIASLALAGSLYLLSNADRFILSAVRPLDEVGIYAATYGVVDLVFRLVPSVLFVVVRPRVFQAWDQGKRLFVVRTSMTVAALLACVSAALSVALILVATTSSILPMRADLAGLIAAGLTAFVIANAMGLVYAAGLRQARLAGHFAVAAVGNIALNVLITPSLGAYGASLATLVAYIGLLALNLWGLRAEIGLHRVALLAVTLSLVTVTILGFGAGTSEWPILAAGATVLIACILAGLVADVIATFRRSSRPSEESQLS